MGGYWPLCLANILPICLLHLGLFCLKRTSSVKSPCLHDIISLWFLTLSFIELPFIETPTPVISSPALAPVISSPASWARMAKARLAEQVLSMWVHQDAWFSLNCNHKLTLNIHQTEKWSSRPKWPMCRINRCQNRKLSANISVKLLFGPFIFRVACAFFKLMVGHEITPQKEKIEFNNYTTASLP